MWPPPISVGVLAYTLFGVTDNYASYLFPFFKKWYEIIELRYYPKQINQATENDTDEG